MFYISNKSSNKRRPSVKNFRKLVHLLVYHLSQSQNFPKIFGKVFVLKTHFGKVFVLKVSVASCHPTFLNFTPLDISEAITTSQSCTIQIRIHVNDALYGSEILREYSYGFVFLCCKRVLPNKRLQNSEDFS